MSTPVYSLPESIRYLRSAALPGLELLEAKHSARQWRVIGAGCAVVVSHSWHGDVLYRGTRHRVEPGRLFCNDPDELLIANPELERPGSFSVLILHNELLESWADEQQIRVARPQWRATTSPLSPALRARFLRFFQVMSDPSSELLLESRASELAELMIGELVCGATHVTASTGLPVRGAARMREFLHEDGLSVDLSTLAREAGLGRFQALRAFKRRYGLPPHAYQLCRRIEFARRMLLEGRGPAEVAAHCGFVDQSHFTRQFKRALGVTPMVYAQSVPRSAKRSSGVHRIAPIAGEEFVMAEGPASPALPARRSRRQSG